MIRNSVRLIFWTLIAALTTAKVACTEDDGEPDGEPDASACYSPWSDYLSAYDDDAVGCACVSESQGVCIEQAALVCDEGRWAAVEDGPCMMTYDACSAPVVSVEICLAQYRNCRVQKPGEVCGRDELETPCPSGAIVESEAKCLMDDAFCFELDDGRLCTGPSSPTCPAHYIPTPNYERCDPDTWSCFNYSESLSCTLPVYTQEECEAAPGQAQSEPGGGSLMEVGCPDDRKALAFIDAVDAGWDEGGLCCEI